MSGSRTIATALLRLALAAAVALPLAGCDGPGPIGVGETTAKVLRERAGTGRAARSGDRVCVRYRVRLPDGREVIAGDRSCFTIGEGGVIEGIDEAVRGMRLGGERVVACPPQQHWGRQGYGPIPPNTTITIELELRSIG